MNRAQKEAFVTEFAEDIAKAQAVALLSFAKLDVETMTQFRLSLRKRDIHVRVVKNTLAKRVFGQTPHTGVNAHLTGPTLVAFSEGDPVVAAKAIVEWATKENVDIKVKSGIALGQFMDTAQVIALSKLPGKNEMFVGFLWALKSGPTKFLYALQDAPRRLGYALAALQEKKEKESSN